MLTVLLIVCIVIMFILAFSDLGVSGMHAEEMRKVEKMVLEMAERAKQEQEERAKIQWYDVTPEALADPNVWPALHKINQDLMAGLYNQGFGIAGDVFLKLPEKERALFKARKK